MVARELGIFDAKQEEEDAEKQKSKKTQETREVLKVPAGELGSSSNRRKVPPPINLKGSSSLDYFRRLLPKNEWGCRCEKVRIASWKCWPLECPGNDARLSFF